MPPSVHPSMTVYRGLTFTAGLLMLLPLPIMQFVGEEGFMAIKSYEMFVRHDWLHPSLFGGVWPHSPLWHWPVILISQIIGWEHVDIAIRLVSVMASWLCALAVGMTSSWLFGEKYPHAGWLGALVYISMGEIAFWYGWLGYVDATFGMFIFAAIASLWRAISDEHIGWFLLSLVLISLAFMTKNITAYALYGMSGFVLLWQLQRWQLLKSPLFLASGVAALAVPWLWQQWVILPGQNTATTTLADAWRNFSGYSIFNYLWHWISYPAIFIFRALPVSLFILWICLRRQHRFTFDKTLTTVASVLFVCFLPFWLSAGGSPRYLVPLYGLVALLLTGLLLQLDSGRLRQGVMLIALLIVLKIPYSLLVLPYIKDWRPERDVKQVAREIIQLTDDAPLTTENNVSTGLAIAAYIDVWRQDRPPIHWNNRKVRAYVLTKAEAPGLGRLVKSWRLRGDHVYLYLQPGT